MSALPEGSRLRWKLYGWLCKLPNICPARAHSVLIWRTDRDPRIDDVCRRDCENNGVCWCGKLRALGHVGKLPTVSARLFVEEFGEPVGWRNSDTGRLWVLHEHAGEDAEAVYAEATVRKFHDAWWEAERQLALLRSEGS
jgi:hypothetical protein